MPLSMIWRAARYFNQKPDPGRFFEYAAIAALMRNSYAIGPVRKFYADDSVAEINSEHLKNFAAKVRNDRVAEFTRA
ncbi:MAG TPA: hypothetical protein VGQ54_07275 [Burkholderiales bacterium]|jgi:hypothetical protein|nr:hypothetical protein [Burkholderiales bacterium]